MPDALKEALFLCMNNNYFNKLVVTVQVMFLHLFPHIVPFPTTGAVHGRLAKWPATQAVI